MSIDYAGLRAQLVGPFDEDVVHDTLVDLLEEEARGVAILNPLHWCRRAAGRHRLMVFRRQRHDVSHIPRDLAAADNPTLRMEAKELLIGYETEALDTDLSPNAASARVIRSRNRKRRREAAA